MKKENHAGRVPTEQIRTSSKNAEKPSHNLNAGQNVMYLDKLTKRLCPAIIKMLRKEPKLYDIETPEVAVYRRTQQYLKPYKPREKAKECEEDKTPQRTSPGRGHNGTGDPQIGWRYKQLTELSNWPCKVGMT